MLILVGFNKFPYAHGCYQKTGADAHRPLISTVYTNPLDDPYLVPIRLSHRVREITLVTVFEHPLLLSFDWTVAHATARGFELAAVGTSAPPSEHSNSINFYSWNLIRTHSQQTVLL